MDAVFGISGAVTGAVPGLVSGVLTAAAVESWDLKSGSVGTGFEAAPEGGILCAGGEGGTVAQEAGSTLC